MKLSPDKIKKILNNEIANIVTRSKSFSVSETVFTRSRKLPLDKLLRLILSMSGKDLKCEIMDFFNFNTKLPTVSAFVQQRDKLSYKAFEQLFHNFTKLNKSMAVS